MTNDQEDLLLMVARIVLSRLQQRQPGQTENADPPDEYARECARLIDELRPYDQPPASEAQQ